MINRFVERSILLRSGCAREVLPQEIKRLGLHKAFVATDKDLIKFGVADKVLKVLRMQVFLMKYSVKSNRILP